MDPQELLWTALRALAVYALMLVVIRLLGKRTVGNFTAFDLLVALMLGEVVDEIIYGDVNFAQGAVAILVIAAAKYATSWITYGSQKAANILEGKPTPLVRDGELLHDGMRSEIMTEADTMASLRLQGISDVREVKIAILEVDGEVSVIKQDWAEPVQKSDVFEKAPELEPDESKKTDSRRALGLE